MRNLTALGLITLFAAGCHKPPASHPTVDFATSKRLSQIMLGIVGQHRFSPADRAYTVAVAHRDTVQSAAALGYLGLAAQRGLYPVTDFQNLTKEKIKRANPSDVQLYLTQYRLYTGLNGMPTGAAYTKFKSLMRSNIATGIYPDDRAFITTELASKVFGDQTLAASLLCAKSKLGPADLKWSEAQIDAKIAISKGKELDYWKLVMAVLAKKS